MNPLQIDKRALDELDSDGEYSAILVEYPDLMSAEEVAEVLSVKQSTVNTLLREGRMRGVKVGKVWRVTKTAFVRYMKENENG